MRKVARARNADAGAIWILLHECADGVYVFPFASDRDGSASGDEWFADLEEAYAACEITFDARRQDWIDIGDPLPDCQQDWISPVRIVGRSAGAAEWGHLERLVDGQWIPIVESELPSVEEAIRCEQ